LDGRDLFSVGDVQRRERLPNFGPGSRVCVARCAQAKPAAIATTHILSFSDSTGFVAVARGQDKSARDFHGVGRGKSQAAADKKAFDLLNQAGAGAEQKIVYHYFSYGADSK